jgi:murein DD-endopeptidase MepM/ murein hydrolase activator NlpD
MSNNKRPGRGIFGGGYYIALILCAAAIGITGFVYYRNSGEEEAPALQDSQLQATVPVAILEEDFTVGATLPEKTQPAETEGQIQPKRVLKTGSPLVGETVAEYAMDCLSYNQTTRDWRVHNGIDIAAEAGTQVVAAAQGQVYTVYEDETMGHTVVIRHEDGYVTTYSSLAEEISVTAGDTVELGQAIGTVGDTALIETAMGPHLHFSVKHNDTDVDPNEFLNMNP